MGRSAAIPPHPPLLRCGHSHRRRPLHLSSTHHWSRSRAVWPGATHRLTYGRTVGRLTSRLTPRPARRRCTGHLPLVARLWRIRGSGNRFRTIPQSVPCNLTPGRRLHLLSQTAYTASRASVAGLGTRLAGKIRIWPSRIVPCRRPGGAAWRTSSTRLILTSEMRRTRGQMTTIASASGCTDTQLLGSSIHSTSQ